MPTVHIRPLCEFIDSTTDSLTIGVRVPGLDLAEGTRYRLRLRPRFGQPAQTALAVASIRVNAVGEQTRSAFSFQVSTELLANGALCLELSPADVDEWVGVRPAPGLLASSRPTRVGRRRFQVFPAAGAPATWVRFSAWTRSARIGWAVRNVAREVPFIARRRRFTWVRAARALTRPFVPPGAIWLIGERPETARDNGYALFRHLRATDPTAPVYYVISRKSPLTARVRSLGHVVWHSSWRHRVLMLHAEVLANAYSIKHMLPSRWRPGAYMSQFAWRVGARRVYLKHGVHLSPEAMKRANGGYDLVCTVGEQESAAIARSSGYTTTQLRCTGLARYDQLIAAPNSDTVLFMPTWRRYLVPKLFAHGEQALVPYEGSTYQGFIDSFLGDPATQTLLERHDLRLIVVPHYNLNGLLTQSTYPGNRIEVVDGATADIPALLRGCAALVTDYSSVQFDVAYAGTPVIYAQFDQDEYARGHSAPSWFRAERDGFGPVCTTAVDVRATLEEYARRNFAREVLYTARVGKFFSYRDQHNSDRVVREITALTSGDLALPDAGPRSLDR